MCRCTFICVSILAGLLSSGTSLFIDSSEEVVTGRVAADKTTEESQEVICYCNMPACVSTNYMCKSPKLGCFSDLAVMSSSSLESMTHGCLELLEKSHQSECRNLPKEGVVYSPQSASKSFFLCCTQDMCNHVDSPENHLELNSHIFNGSGKFMERERERERLRQPMPHSYGNPEVWFKAATIAVPICGALILFVLIALAIKLLQSDANCEHTGSTKLRMKDGATYLLSPQHFHNCTNSGNDYNASNIVIKKVPLLYRYDRSFPTEASYPGQRVNLLQSVLHTHQIEEKNKANEKLNNVQNVQNGVQNTLNLTESPTVLDEHHPLYNIHKQLNNCSSSNNNNNNINNSSEHSCNIYQDRHVLATDALLPCASELTSVHSLDECKLKYKKAFMVPFNTTVNNQ